MDAFELKPEKIISRNLWNLYGTISQIAELPHSETEDYCFVNAAPWPYLIYQINRKVVLQPDRLNQLINRMERKEIPPFIMIHPDINDETLQKQLTVSGFRQIVRWPGMIRSSVETSGKKESGTLVKTIKNPDELADWLAIVQTNLFNENRLIPEFKKVLGNSAIRLYYAESEGKMVATTLVYLHSTTAGIYMVSVLEKYRGKGIAGKMLQDIMDMEDYRTIKHFVLQANSKSEKLYDKLGFKTIGNFDIYWKFGLF